MRLALIAALLLSLAGCQDDFTIDGSDASADASTLDVNGLDAASDDGGAQDDAAMTDTGAEDAAITDAAITDAATDVTSGDSAVAPACAPPWLYYLVQSDDAAPYVARYSITEDGTARCPNLSGGDAIADLASSALVVDDETMILAGPETLQQLNLADDRIEWTISTDLDFTPLGHIALFYVGATSFGVGWDRDGPSLDGVSVRAVSDGAVQRELDVNWKDATAAPERAGDLWIVGRSSLGANVAQRYVVGSQSSVEEIEVSAARVSTVGDRLVITTSTSYRLYALEDGGPSFIDTVFLPSAECRIVDTVGHPLRDDAVFVGCGADGNIESVRIHNRTSDSYEVVGGSLSFSETALSLALYEG